MIEVRIGVADAPKELVLETEESPEKVVELVNAALGGGSDLLWLTDRKGKQIGVPPAKVAYVEVEPESGPRPVGFGSG